MKKNTYIFILFIVIASCVNKIIIPNDVTEQLTSEDAFDYTWLTSEINSKTRVDFATKYAIRNTTISTKDNNTQLHFDSYGNLVYKIVDGDSTIYDYGKSNKELTSQNENTVRFSYHNEADIQTVAAINDIKDTLKTIIFKKDIPIKMIANNRTNHYYYQTLGNNEKKLQKKVTKSDNGQIMLTTFFTYNKKLQLIKKEEKPGDFWEGMKYESGLRQRVYNYSYTKDTVFTEKEMIIFRPKTLLPQKKITQIDTIKYNYTFY